MLNHSFKYFLKPYRLNIYCKQTNKFFYFLIDLLKFIKILICYSDFFLYVMLTSYNVFYKNIYFFNV